MATNFHSTTQVMERDFANPEQTEMKMLGSDLTALNLSSYNYLGFAGSVREGEREQEGGREGGKQRWKEKKKKRDRERQLLLIQLRGLCRS